MYPFNKSYDEKLNNIVENQGKQMLDFNSKHFQEINVSRILETCDKSVCSIRESMDQYDSTTVNIMNY